MAKPLDKFAKLNKKVVIDKPKKKVIEQPKQKKRLQLAYDIHEYINDAYNVLSDAVPEEDLNLNLPIIQKVLDKFGITSAQYLGKGNFGVAFDIGDERVLKITADDLEIKIAAILKGKKIQCVAEYYEVGKSKSLGVGFLILKKYNNKIGKIDNYLYHKAYNLFSNNRTGNITEKELDNSSYFGNSRQKMFDLVEKNLKNLKYTKVVTKEKFKNVFIRLILKNDINMEYGIKNDLQFAIDAITAKTNLLIKGIQWKDDHMGNFAMGDDGHYVAIDIGYSRVNKEAKIMTLENIYREV